MTSLRGGLGALGVAEPRLRANHGGMATHLGAHLSSLRDELRFQPVSRRIRVSLDGHPVADTTAACLVWEPHRIVPLYAVPVADVSAGLVPVDNVSPPDPVPAVLPPMQVFEIHLAGGQSYDVWSPTGCSAGVLVYENVWAAPLARELRRGGAQLVASGRIPVQALLAAAEATPPAPAG